MWKKVLEKLMRSCSYVSSHLHKTQVAFFPLIGSSLQRRLPALKKFFSRGMVRFSFKAPLGLRLTEHLRYRWRWWGDKVEQVGKKRIRGSAETKRERDRRLKGRSDVRCKRRRHFRHRKGGKGAECSLLLQALQTNSCIHIEMLLSGKFCKHDTNHKPLKACKARE